MANTEALLGLIDEYTGAFADPEATPEDPTVLDMAEPDEEGRTGETPQLYGNMDAQVWAKEFCEKLKDSAYLSDGDAIGTMTGWFANAIMTGYDNGYSEGIASAKTITVDSGVIEFEQEPSKGSAPVFDLPETYARQGTEGCASGMCPADH